MYIVPDYVYYVPDYVYYVNHIMSIKYIVIYIVGYAQNIYKKTLRHVFSSPPPPPTHPYPSPTSLSAALVWSSLA